MSLLNAAVTREPARTADAACALDPPCGVVAAADLAHLAGRHELAEGFERLVERHRTMIDVRVVEVDMVGVQAAETAVDGDQDRSAREVFAGHAPGLAGHEQPVAVAAAAHPASQSASLSPPRP